MKNRVLISIIFLLMIFMYGCSQEYVINDGTIQLTREPIYGKYKLITKYNKNGEKSDVADDSFLFAKDRVYIIGHEYSNIRFMTKIVSVKDFLSNDFNIKNLNIEGEKSIIASLYSEGDHICDIIIFNDDQKIWVRDSDYIYEANYVGSVKSEDFTNTLSLRKNWNKDTSLEIIRPSCLFLGIRDDSLEISRYTTVFIYKDSSVLEIYKSPSIVLPKNSGYIRVDMIRDISGGTLIDYLDYKYESKMSRFNKYIESPIKFKKYRAYKTMKIDYMNPQFLSVSFYRNNYGRKNFNNTLSIFPLEKSSLTYPLDLFDIFGKEPIDIIKRNISRDQYQRLVYDKDNIGIKRRNGYWVLIARMFDISGTKPETVDISLKEYTSKLLKNENAQSINAEEINKLFSNVIDFTTGPERNLAVIKTSNAFKIVSFNDKELSIDQEILLDAPESAMFMNLWYTGTEASSHRFNVKTANIWEKIF